MKAGVFKEEYIAILVRELLKGLEYLHGEGKLHRDIKGALRHASLINASEDVLTPAANILLTSGGDGELPTIC